MTKPNPLLKAKVREFRKVTKTRLVGLVAALGAVYISEWSKKEQDLEADKLFNAFLEGNEELLETTLSQVQESAVKGFYEVIKEYEGKSTVDMLLKRFIKLSHPTKGKVK
jgi:hypothetical protein